MYRLVQECLYAWTQRPSSSSTSNIHMKSPASRLSNGCQFGFGELSGRPFSAFFAGMSSSLLWREERVGHVCGNPAMDSTQLREIHAPLKERYREDAHAAEITLSA